jgi:hypothetical protein
MGDATVVIVSGAPRSGTSLMMRILEAAGLAPLCDEARPPDADNPHGYYELDAVKRSAQDHGWLRGAGGRAVKVVQPLLRHLPSDRRYRVILMRRDPDAVARSQEAMLARRGAAPEPEPDGAATRISLVRQLRAAETLLESRPEFDWLGVDYERLVSDAEPELERVILFLGLDATAAELASIVEPALQRQRPAAG